jgi:hypothetical protein
MSTSTPRRIYIDRGPSREEAIIRRVLVPKATVSPATHEPVSSRRNAETLFGLGRLVRGQLLRRPR